MPDSQTPKTVNQWLLALPCVTDGSVLVDMRGVYPVAILASNRQTAREIRTQDDMIFFVTGAL